MALGETFIWKDYGVIIMRGTRLVLVGVLALVALSFAVAVLNRTFGPCRPVQLLGVGTDGVHGYVKANDKDKSVFMWNGKIWEKVPTPERMSFFEGSTVFPVDPTTMKVTSFRADDDGQTVWVGGGQPTYVVSSDCHAEEK